MRSWTLVGLDYADLTPLQMLRDAGESGVSGVELFTEVNLQEAEHREIDHATEDAAATIRFVSSLAYLLSSERGTAHAQEQIQESLLLAARTRAIGTVCMTGDFRGGTSAEAVKHAADALAPIVAQAESLQLTLCIENVFNRGGIDPSGNPETLLEILTTIDSPNLGVNLDVGNLVIAGVDPVAAIDTLWSHIRYMHWKDVAPADLHPRLDDLSRPLRPSDKPPFASVPMGQGLVPLEDCWQRARELPSTVPMAMELFCTPSARSEYLAHALAWRDGLE